MCPDEEFDGHIDLIYRRLRWIELNLNFLVRIKQLLSKAQGPYTSIQHKVVHHWLEVIRGAIATIYEYLGIVRTSIANLVKTIPQPRGAFKSSAHRPSPQLLGVILHAFLKLSRHQE